MKTVALGAGMGNGLLCLLGPCHQTSVGWPQHTPPAGKSSSPNPAKPGSLIHPAQGQGGPHAHSLLCESEARQSLTRQRKNAVDLGS
jgi:hypothetical protein